jgi:hypothetical protein
MRDAHADSDGCHGGQLNARNGNNQPNKVALQYNEQEATINQTKDMQETMVREQVNGNGNGNSTMVRKQKSSSTSTGLLSNCRNLIL